MPVVRKALADAGQTYQYIDALAVTQGPGLAGALLVQLPCRADRPIAASRAIAASRDPALSSSQASSTAIPKAAATAAPAA